MIEYVSLPELEGSGAGTTTSSAPINGELLGVYVASNSGGTVTLTAGGAAPVTLMTLTGGAGTSWYYPRVQGCNADGTAVANVYDTVPLADYVSVAENSGGTVSVTLAISH